MYMRIQARYVGRLGVEVGVFTAVDHLRRANRLSAEDEAAYLDIDDWFLDQLPTPPFYEDGNLIRAVTWFRDPLPHEMLVRIDRLRMILTSHGVEHDLIRSADPGEIVYEDPYQVGVVPRVRHEQTPLPDGLDLGPTYACWKRSSARHDDRGGS